MNLAPFSQRFPLLLLLLNVLMCCISTVGQVKINVINKPRHTRREEEEEKKTWEDCTFCVVEKWLRYGRKWMAKEAVAAGGRAQIWGVVLGNILLIEANCHLCVLGRGVRFWPSSSKPSVLLGADSPHVCTLINWAIPSKQEGYGRWGVHHGRCNWMRRKYQNWESLVLFFSFTFFFFLHILTTHYRYNKNL